MKKRILALLLVIAMTLTVLPVFASEATPAWTGNGTTVTEAGDGYYSISGIEYATTAYTTEKVQLEGLTIEMKVTNLGYKDGSNQAAGILFSAEPNATYSSGAAAAMTLWYAPYGNSQSRFHVGANHDYNTASYAYTSPSCETVGFGLASSMVLNNVSNGDIKIEINSHDENTYAVKFTIAQNDLLWGDNCNYADEADGSHSCTFYMKKSTFANALDAEGKLYVSASGLMSPNYSIRVTESDVVVTPPAVDTTEPTATEPEATEPAPTAPSIIGTADSDWVTYAGGATGTYADNGYTNVSGMAAWGHRAYYKHLVKLDGLELSFRATTVAGDCVGVVFSNSNGAYFGDGSNFAITYWNELYSNQARLHFGTNHNYNSASVVHTAPDSASTTGFGVATSMVCSQAPTMGWTIKFESYNDEFYSVKITMTDSTMWGDNANYNGDEKSCTVYLPKAAVADMLNENGELYVIAAGFPSGANPACSAEYKIVDDNYRAYIGGEAVTDAIAKVEAYQNAAASITDAASYDAAMAARAEAVACAGSLRARELAELALLVGGVDAELAANGEIVEIVKKAVTDKIDAAKAAYAALIADKTTINNDTLAAALALATDANAEYTVRASMLNDEAKAEIDAALADLAYSHDLCIVLQWVAGYEAKVNALDASDPSIVNALVDVKAYKEAFASTAAYTKLTTVLTAEDKAAQEAAIAAADAAVVNMETVVLPQLKESYIVAMEEKLNADLTIKPNLDDAKAAYAEIATYVTITEADGELYARYVAGYNTLKAACEAYLRAHWQAGDLMVSHGCGDIDLLNEQIAAHGDTKR